MPFPFAKIERPFFFGNLVEGHDYQCKIALGKGTTSVVPTSDADNARLQPLRFAVWTGSYSGIFPCFFSGFLSRLVSSMASA